MTMHPLANEVFIVSRSHVLLAEDATGFCFSFSDTSGEEGKDAMYF